jgi:hypothetical protein
MMDTPEQGVPPDHFEVGVVVAKRRLNGPWATHSWLPQAVLPAAPETPPWTLLRSSEDEELFYAGACTVTLARSDTAHYRDNLTSGRPSLWVALRPIGGDEYEVSTVTADPYEGEGMAEGVGEIIEAVPMPAEVQAKVAAFFDAFHVERQFFKRKRDRADPNALAHRPRAGASRKDEE